MIRRRPAAFIVSTACGIVCPDASGTVCCSFSPGPDETLSVTCAPDFAEAPSAGDCAVTVPNGSSLGTYWMLASSPASTRRCTADLTSPDSAGTLTVVGSGSDGAGSLWLGDDEPDSEVEGAWVVSV